MKQNMDKYTDRNGNQISVGDVIIYDEGEGFGQSIDEVVEYEGQLAGVMRVGKPKWTILEDQAPLPLKFCKLYPSCSDNTAIYCTVVDVEHEVAFTVDFAEQQFKRKHEDK